jgi:hypothetical protein
MNQKELENFEASFEPTTPKIKKLLEFADELNNYYGEEADDLFDVEIQERFGAAYETLTEESYRGSKPEPFVFGGWNLLCKEQDGGEGQGDDYWVVIEAAKKGEESKFFKVPGWYSSGNGSELTFSETFRVQPVQVLVNQWQKYKKQK